MTPLESRLTQLAENGRLPKGMLFSGPEPTSLLSAALLLAQKMLCQAPQSPCGSCGACLRVKQNEHPDVLRIAPEKQEIPIETIRELSLWVARAPFEARVKLAIIEEADRLSTSAANSLLKTLEEPPPHAHLILTTNSPDSLLKTILSRTFQVRFPAIASTTPVDAFEDAPWRKTLNDLSQGRIPPRVETLFSLTEEVAKDKDELRAFFFQLEGILLSQLREAQASAFTLRVKHLDSVFTDVQRAERDLLQRYGNPALTIDSILLRWLTP